MGVRLGRAVWAELIDQMVAQKRRLVEFSEYESDTRPNPPATEEQLRAAEDRLGRSLDPQHRELLSVANGWEHFFISYSLLGTDDIGAGRRWEFGIEQTREWFEYEEWAEEIGAAHDSSQYHLVIENDNGYSGTLYLFVGQAHRLATGAGVPLPNDDTYPDLYTYLRRELDAMVAFADQSELGEYSQPWWGRNLRTDPPTIAEIVAKIDELIRIGDPTPPWPTPLGPILRPGATDAELDTLDRHLGGTLHPEHRALLAASNGLSTPYWRIGDILSADDIRDGTRWREAIARKQIHEERRNSEQLHNYRVSGLPDPEPPASVEDRIQRIPATPFAIAGGDDLYGVDTRDGYVRDLLMDSTVTTGAHRSSAGPVRTHLLASCCDLWWHVGGPAEPEQEP
ncbi:SMI1/KNR4 family protein [Nocardia sp. NPDC059240]|uniref:SMI1/KNR4 family protein n=1 Tax=Nocardia sp. NPDC059240 TaxID=3346786 RepID=UPI0036753B15